jgi:hypothetical protein
MIPPFPNSPALDGYHCQTNSLAKIFHHYGHPMSEDMLLGLGAGIGFIYWKMNINDQTSIFIGGRGNNNEFFDDISKRTGVDIKSISTTSAKKAEATLLEKLNRQEPVMLFGDMCYLPWFDFPGEYHFGGHTIVACGYDGEGTVLASDMEAQTAGPKKGFYHPITLEQLFQARNSPYKPFPPKNTYLEFDFGSFRQPTSEDIYPAIRQAAEAHLNPPIKNLGVKGMKLSATELPKWKKMFSDHELRMNLFNLYIFLEIGGTGGGCFRKMYSRFLKEAAAITGNNKLLGPAEKLHQSGEIFTETALLFKDVITATDLEEKIGKACENFRRNAEIEEEAWGELMNNE